MRTRCLVSLIAIMFVLTFVGCGFQPTSEYVTNLQHKIDKAIESEPTYADLKEIVNEYDELLAAEQEQVNNYNKIQQMISDYESDVLNDESVTFSVKAIEIMKTHLKHPDTLDIRSIEYLKGSEVNETQTVHIKFAADNEVGGSAVGAAIYTYVHYPNGEFEDYDWIYFDDDSMYNAMLVSFTRADSDDITNVDVDLIKSILDK